MRSDYALYVVGIILFAITSIVLIYQMEFKELWITTTAVFGFLFFILGYSQRPKPQAKVIEALPPALAPAPPTTPPTAIEVVKEEKAEIVVEAPPLKVVDLTQVKGVKEKRAAQLNALGINSVQDLARASAEDLASKLKISPKITVKWIESAKKLVE